VLSERLKKGHGIIVQVLNESIGERSMVESSALSNREPGV